MKRSRDDEKEEELEETRKTYKHDDDILLKEFAFLLEEFFFITAGGEKAGGARAAKLSELTFKLCTAERERDVYVTVHNLFRRYATVSFEGSGFSSSHIRFVPRRDLPLLHTIRQSLPLGTKNLHERSSLALRIYWYSKTKSLTLNMMEGASAVFRATNYMNRFWIPNQRNNQDQLVNWTEGDPYPRVPNNTPYYVPITTFVVPLCWGDDAVMAHFIDKKLPQQLEYFLSK
jgi:hypothetical protein